MGDEPELQAFSEMFNYRIDVFIPCPYEGARLLRTYNAGAPDGRLIRLSYTGGNHYDSVVSLDNVNNNTLMTTEMENAEGMESQGATEEMKSWDWITTEQNIMAAALQASREEFSKRELLAVIEASLVQYVIEQERRAAEQAAREKEHRKKKTKH